MNYNLNNGYSGSSMSNRAVEAYTEGRKPRNKWEKSDLICELNKIYSSEQVEQLKKFSCEVLKRVFLSYSEWHHTSSYFNKTDFYEVYDGFEFHYAMNSCNEAKKELKAEREEKKDNNKFNCKAYCHYLTWEGTRKHPKAIDHQDYCYIDSNEKWAYFDGFKKSTSSNGFFIIKTFDKAPKGTASIFKKIEKELKK